MFPGDVLLQVFDFCRPEASETWDDHNWWHGLVHICQRWRQLIFTSPRRLGLSLLCTRKTPATSSKIFDFWPNIPIAISVNGWHSLDPTEEDNLLAAFKHSDRVWSVTLSLSRPQAKKVIKMMMKPFPALTNFRVKPVKRLGGNLYPHILPHGFLGGSTSGLRELDLSGISPLGLPSILSSSTDLVNLHLHDLQLTGDVSPDSMVACLAGMTKLESLTIKFRCCPSMFPPNSMTQVILPTLSRFHFQGSHKYLEDLVAQLDAPRLFDLTVMLLVTCTDPVQQLPQLLRFIDHAEDLKLSQFRHACAEIHDVHSFIHFDNAQTGQNPTFLTLGEVKNNEFYSAEFRPMGPLLSQVSAFISSVHHLSITPFHQQKIQDKYWHHAGILMLLRSFDTVETLHVGGQFTNLFPLLLNGLHDELVTEVLPALRFLNFEGKPLKLVEQRLALFIEERQSNGCPLTIVGTPFWRPHSNKPALTGVGMGI